MKYLLRLRPILAPYGWQILVSLLILLLITATQLVVPSIIGNVIDYGLSGGHEGYLVTAALVILGIGLLRAVLSFFQSYLGAWISQHISFDLRNRLYNHIQYLSFSYHDRMQTGQLISRCIEDVSSVQEFTGSGVVELVQILLLILGVAVLLFIDNPRLAFISLLPMIPLIVVTVRFGERVGKMFYAIDQALGSLSARLQENVMGAQVVRAFAREPYEIQRFDVTNRDVYDARVNILHQWSRIMSTSHFLVAFSTILILWFGGNMVLNGEITLGEMVAFNGYLLMIAEPTRQLVWLVNTAGEAGAGLKRTFDVLDLQPEIASPPAAIVLPPLSGRVEFREVNFRYQDETNAALRQINLQVEPNQIVAIIGSTGSGKTSFISLIPRFYDVSHGALLVDGYDLRQVDLPSLRRQIGIVLQTSLLFSDSIRENIAYGRPDASLDEVIAAAKAAQAHEFIMEMPEGYDTVVGERGITLSGGQRQRVAIARALLLNPRILILDDSTSSVDTHTERLIQQALNTLMEGRTTFVIAQRLSTVRRADQIIVLDQGKIAERGTHAELLAKDGLYREIYELQLRVQESSEPSVVGS
ncbi:MAG TPA: ABC transporter ATP-binding protein [Chloroflexi bacterium]|nr:ABC transporter ATP-binding protein [Chloroflexota bacterium]